MYGILREVGVSVSLEQVLQPFLTWHFNHCPPQCDLEEGNLEEGNLETKQGPGGFLDHTCQNEEDLPPFNCKRSSSSITIGFLRLSGVVATGVVSIPKTEN